tara:strand:+ start:489 stop:662 length:174 start_codon:yes stop_codon:yes gene_type:complete
MANECCSNDDVKCQQEAFNDEVIKQFLNIADVLKKQVQLVQHVAKFVGLEIPIQEEE